MHDELEEMKLKERVELEKKNAEKAQKEEEAKARE